MRKIFMWREIRSWRRFVLGLMPQEIEEIIRQQKGRFQYYDDPTPLKNIYSSFSDFDALVKRFTKTFRNNFSHVAMFHCCRPRQLEDYYREGIRILSSDEANEYFRYFCRTTNCIQNISEEDINAAIGSMAHSYGRFGQVYFGLDDHFLIERCGHYLIYGSEYLLSLCSHLRSRIHYDFSARLKRIDIPTVFQVKVPVSQFEDHQLDTLAEAALSAWAYCIAHNRSAPGLVDFAIMASHDLQPEYILGHYHPESIPDPFCGRSLYRYTDETLNSNDG